MEHERVVPKSEGQALAQQFNCPFFETSAKDHVNVDECFRELVREVRKQKDKSPDKKPALDSSIGESTTYDKKKSKTKLCQLL